MKKKIYYSLLALTMVVGFISRKAKATDYAELSALERRTVDDGLAAYGLVPDENPQGKTIGQIFIYTDSPFGLEPEFLTRFNKFHINTKQAVIERELFQKIGDIYDAALWRDAEMRLRSHTQVRSLAVIVPVRKKDSVDTSTIDLLVATRDLWSLKPNFNFSSTANVITNLSVGLGEYNLLGSNRTLSMAYEQNQVNHALSTLYYDPRFLGSRLELSLDPKLLFLKKTFGLDGFVGTLSLERPLSSETDKWGYGVKMEYASKQIVDFVGDHIRTFDIPNTPTVDKIERRYRWQYGVGDITGRRSFGRVHKNEIFAGYSLYVKKPSIPNDLNIKVDEIKAFIDHVLPKDEMESYVTLGYAYFQNSFLTLYDCDNFKLQERKRTGPVISLSSDFSSKPLLLSDHNFLRPQISASLLLPFTNDSYIHTSASSSNRYDGQFKDNAYKFGFKVVSSKILSAFRLVAGGVGSFLQESRDNQSFVLGGGNGLRGVESRFYSGTQAIRGNFEIRSAPLDLWITHVGLTLFYDAGAAFDRWSKANATHAVGFGLRILAPQLSGQLFRVDLGFPIYGRGVGHHVVVPTLGVGQAF